MFKKYLNNRFITLFLIPFIIGSLTTLSFQPFNFTIINLIVIPIFFYLIVYVNKKSKVTYRKRAYKINLFLLGLSFGFGFYLSGISWIVNSLTFDENFQILIPFALILIPLCLSLFMAFTILFVGPYLRLDFSSLILFSGSLALSDYLRAKILTGFPWNLWAYSTSSTNELLQILNIIGLYSYNLLVITVFALPVIIILKINKNIKMLSLVLYIFVILSVYIFGNYTINANKDFLNKIDKKIFVKIISPNFDLKYGLTKNKLKRNLKN